VHLVLPIVSAVKFGMRLTFYQNMSLNYVFDPVSF